MLGYTDFSLERNNKKMHLFLSGFELIKFLLKCILNFEKFPSRDCRTFRGKQEYFPREIRRANYIVSLFFL